jgi:hypothetical protein
MKIRTAVVSAAYANAQKLGHGAPIRRVEVSQALAKAKGSRLLLGLLMTDRHSIPVSLHVLPHHIVQIEHGYG